MTTAPLLKKDIHLVLFLHPLETPACCSQTLLRLWTPVALFAVTQSPLWGRRVWSLPVQTRKALLSAKTLIERPVWVGHLYFPPSRLSLQDK